MGAKVIGNKIPQMKYSNIWRFIHLLCWALKRFQYRFSCKPDDIQKTKKTNIYIYIYFSKTFVGKMVRLDLKYSISLFLCYLLGGTYENSNGNPSWTLERRFDYSYSPFLIHLWSYLSICAFVFLSIYLPIHVFV